MAPSYGDPDPADLEFFEKDVRPILVKRCLGCHGESQRFLSSPTKKDMLPELMSGKTSCLDCHAPAHPEQKKEARR